MSELSNSNADMKTECLNHIGNGGGQIETYEETSLNGDLFVENQPDSIAKAFDRKFNGIDEKLKQHEVIFKDLNGSNDVKTCIGARVQFSDSSEKKNEDINNKANIVSQSNNITNGNHQVDSLENELAPEKNDKTATHIAVPFPFLAGEFIEHQEMTQEHSIHLTNYRLYVIVFKRAEECNMNNYHQQEQQQFCLPINNIDSVEIRDLYFLTIYTKYIESFVITFQNAESATLWHKRLSDIQDIEIERLFCFEFYRSLIQNQEMMNSSKINQNDKINDLISINKNVIKMYPCQIFENEFSRMNFDPKFWRICELNKDFKFCNSYPQHFIVPSEMNDKELECVANFRYSRRIPVVVWRNQHNGCVILRSSQPVVGWFGWRNNQDERMLQKILKICSKSTQHDEQNIDPPKQLEENKSTNLANGINVNGYHASNNLPNGDSKMLLNGQLNGNGNVCNLNSTPVTNNICHNNTNNVHHSIETSDQEEGSSNKLLILDARSYTAAFANRAMGGGCECPEYYTSCDVQFMGLNNIHSIRKSFYQLRYICESSQIDQSNWFTLLDNTKWLHNLASLLKAAVVVVDAITIQERPVLVHCSDGWDRTPQVIALAELMLDPFYRTIEGFKVLIEKEWLQFGHKFADRCRSSTLNIDPNERCPVFLQWVDCVYQLIKQFPHEFEFNVFYLMKLVYHSYSCLFGTFTCNNVQERVAHHVYDRTISLWAYFEINKSNFVNFLYLPQQEILRPSCRVKDIIFWNEVYVPVSNDNNSVTNLISCSGICNSNISQASNRNSATMNDANNVDDPDIGIFNCNHEIRCQSQSKCDLNRFASLESLYNHDALKQSEDFISKNFNHNLRENKHHWSDSCLLKKSQMPNVWDKFIYLSVTKNNPDPFKNMDFKAPTFHHNKNGVFNGKDVTNLDPSKNGYALNHDNESNGRFYAENQSGLNDNSVSSSKLIIDSASTKVLFDVDGQIISKNNNQMQLVQMINYHKRMIRCLTYQLKSKKATDSEQTMFRKN